ncbi:MAG TPA: hypothetical protein VGB75_12125 [Jatrophihabitans sp.]|jgi:hypothetical protein|uniref:hypothetical protein n=1 Tax=Jatrophihabitans sp. TaxID=1932789 RepID=UPI002EED404B
MAKRVYVTKAQQAAAKMIVERNTANGKPVPPAISKIANAASGPDSRPVVTDQVGAGDESSITGVH